MQDGVVTLNSATSPRRSDGTGRQEGVVMQETSVTVPTLESVTNDGVMGEVDVSMLNEAQ